jgi:hypothetical protein
MRRTLLLLLLLFQISYSWAQKPLTNSRRSSFYTYIYRLNDEAVLQFINGKQKTLKDELLTDEVAKYPTDHPQEVKLPEGNYLRVTAVENRLQYKLIQKHTANLMLLDNGLDTRFILMDNAGVEIINAQPYLHDQLVPYDSHNQVYHSKRYKRDTIIKVVYNGVSNFFAIKEQQPYKYGIKKDEKKGISLLWQNIKRSFKNNPVKPDPYTQPTQNLGFIALNKPKYRPGDTIKLKGFVLQKRSHLPINDEQVEVHLKTWSSYFDKVIGKVSAYKKGAFEYQFKLGNEPNLRLDDDYYIALQSLPPAKTINGDKNYLFKSKAVFLLSNGFRFEDYELKATKFTARIDNRIQSPGIPVKIYFKAIDENGLAVPDGRVNTVLFAQGATDYKGNHVFVPDTLWHNDMPLDPVGETTLSIPDSIFPQAKINYFARFTFLNSNNESRRIDENFIWDHHTRKIVSKIENDTLRVNYLVNGKSQPTKALIQQVNIDRDTLNATVINLPAIIAKSSNAVNYIVKVDSLTENADIGTGYTEVRATGYRTVDSLFIKVLNSAHSKFWYTIFAGNKVIDEGAATELSYKKPFKYAGNAAIVINYFWQGMLRYNEQTFNPHDRYLNIDIKQPTTVYPGQQATIAIDVKDNFGKPVANADVTAYAITRKFENYQLPEIPYLGKAFSPRKIKPWLVFKKLQNTSSLKLNWQYRSKAMGLDTIKYYQFTHADDLYQITEPTPDSITQIAPFVVKDGDILPVHILYIDERPVYFSQSNDMQRYSFRVSQGSHTLRFRTTDQLIKLDNVSVQKGQKLIIALNADTTKNKKAVFKKMPDTLLTYEAELVNKYMANIDPNFGEHMVTLEQGDNTFLIDPNIYVRGNNILVGPFADNDIKLNVKEGYSKVFRTEPGYSFSFGPDQIKQKSLPYRYSFLTGFTSVKGDTDYRQYVLSKTETDSIWQRYKDYRHKFFYYGTKYIQRGATLVLKVGRLSNGDDPHIMSIAVCKKNDPNDIVIVPATYPTLSSFESGIYDVFYLLSDGRYHLQENIIVKAHGTNFYNSGTIYLHPADSVSFKFMKIINAQTLNYAYTYPARNLKKELFNEKYLNKVEYKGEMTGGIFDKATNEPLSGTVVRVVGTKVSVQADIDGFFRIKVPKRGKLQFLMIGYKSTEIKIGSGHFVNVYMITDGNTLNETVITGYGYARRGSDKAVGTPVRINGKEFAGGDASQAIRSLQGKVSGSNTQLEEGGLAYIIDGIPASEVEYKTLTPYDIINVSILKPDAAVAIYGDKGLNGVALVTTRKGSGLAGAAGQQLQTMRHNFADYAYWQPRLTTDAQGKAKFTVTYPDDITNWRTIVIGMTDKRQAGIAEGQVNAFKSVSANFVSPLFAVRGDTFSALGKVLNYTTDSVKLKRTFNYNGKVIADKDITVKNALIDTFKLVAGTQDSLSFEYNIKRGMGYTDGEQRVIPVFEQGGLETKGSFAVLAKDTSIRLQFSPNLKDVTLRAEASIFPALLDETEHLRTYEYLCNEQLASKLKALLAEKQIRTYLGQTFKWDKDINNLIKKLLDNQNGYAVWGWWKGAPDELWVTSYVVEALLKARALGFKVDLQNLSAGQYIAIRFDQPGPQNDLLLYPLLNLLYPGDNLKVAVRAYEKLLSQQKQLSDVDKYRLMLNRQLAGMPIVIDSLLKGMNRTMLGNVYWGKKAYNFFDNAIQQSLLAYRILKNEGDHAELLVKLRNYFMEQRSDGYWRNTYESAEILETILPDMLVGGQKPSPASLVISGDKNETVTQFPYTATLGANAKLTIAKTGGMPVYITAYQKFWNPEPKKVSGDLAVDTWFQKGADKITRVKGGEAITLYAEVTVKADADFVMVEVPIPAGCSYDGKEQGYYYGGEVHREYFKNKVSIFCRKLTVGKYKFAVKLMPRYSGTYHLNPAKAEMMYFPVFYGREALKQFDIVN